MKTYSIISRKGGCAKTTTTINTAGALIEQGFNVLMIDLDSQCNLTVAAGLSLQEQSNTYDLLTGKTTAKESIHHTDNGDIIPGSAFLSGIDSQLKRESILRDKIRPLTQYDFVLCDLPSQLGSVTTNALTASDEAILPVLADPFSLQSIPLVFETINAVKAHSNKKLTVAGILICRYSSIARINKDMLFNMRRAAEHYGTRVFDTQIRENSAVREAEAMQQSVIAYAPKSNGALDYKSFTQELLTTP